MLEYLQSNDDVIAMRCGGKLTAAELEAYMDRLEASLKRHDKTHLYAEIVDFSGFETERFGDLMKRSPAYFRHLDRIGRVAIVADQAWIRWAARIESAILPHVSYETFEPGQRERALAWVQGETPHPRDAAIKIIETDRADVFAFEIDGPASRAELDAISAHFLQALESQDRVRVLGRIRRLAGFEIGGLLTGDYFAMKRRFLERMERYAVVGGPDWMRAVLNTLAPLFKAEIRHFAEGEEEEAWTWVGARPVSERTLV